MEQEEFVSLIRRLRDMDVTKKFEDKIAVLEQQFKTTDEKARDLLRDEFNRLAKEIEDEHAMQKQGF